MNSKLLINSYNYLIELPPNTKTIKNTFISLLEKYADIERSEIFFAIAYIKKAGIKEIITRLEKILEKKGKVRILTCLDFGLSDIDALRELLSLKDKGDLKLRIYFNKEGNFHPKVYLFKNKENNDIILGSYNLSRWAIETNIECAIHQNNSDLFNDLSSYFQFLWRDSINLSNKLVEDYSSISKQIEKQNQKLQNKINDIVTSSEKEELNNIDSAEIEDILVFIDDFCKEMNVSKEILFWRDTAIDEVITLLKESNKLNIYNQRQLIIKLIKEDNLHYKSTKATGAWLNYQLFMQSIGFWDESQITKLGKLALEKYERSYFDFILFLQFCILVTGNLFSLIIALNKANEKNSEIINKASRIKKEDWINTIVDKVNSFLEEKSVGNIGKESLNRYFPGLFSKFAMNKYLVQIKPTAYTIDINKLIEFIKEYSNSLNLFRDNSEDDFITNL
ncbi:MAG: phospholipase D-like domain-containing protein [Candidatus Heimdallarchaeaceae archaeon]